MNHEFILIFDLYDELPPKEGAEPEWKLIKTNCTKKWSTNLFNITDCREIISNKGKIVKDKCEIFNKFENRWLTVKEEYSKVKTILKRIEKKEKRIKIKGFKND